MHGIYWYMNMIVLKKLIRKDGRIRLCDYISVNMYIYIYIYIRHDDAL